MMLRLALAAVATLALLTLHALLAPPARAESWGEPVPMEVPSPNGQWVFGVTVGYLEDPDAPLPPEKRPKCLGTLSRKGPDGVPAQVWSKPLVNEVQPNIVLVADDGSCVVTLDDWAAMGTSSNTVVIYGKDGAVAARLALANILPAEEHAALKAAAAEDGLQSLEWNDGTFEIDLANRRFMFSTGKRFIALDLATGAPVPGKK